VRSPVLFLAAALAVPSLAAAHDLWLEPAGDGLALRYGHHGGELLPVEKAKVKAARCLEAGKARDLLVGAAFTATEVRLPGRCPAGSAFFDGGFYSLTPDGEVNRPRNQVPDAVKSWTSRQFAKWVEARRPGAPAEVLGDELELVAVSDLAKARQGDKITLRLLSRGRPVAGGLVAIDHKTLGEGQGPRRHPRDHQRHAAPAGADPRGRPAGAGGLAHLRGGQVSRALGRLVLAAALALAAGRAAAHETLHEVERGKAIAVKAYFVDGVALAYTSYEVYSPADPRVPWQKGRTDRAGWLAFVPDSPGSWRVKVIDTTGHGLDVGIDAGAQPGAGLPAPAAAPLSTAAFVLRPLLGLAVIAVTFAALVLAYRKKKGSAP
jgi:nickel transport protein